MILIYNKVNIIICDYFKDYLKIRKLYIVYKHENDIKQKKIKYVQLVHAHTYSCILLSWNLWNDSKGNRPILLVANTAQR